MKSLYTYICLGILLISTSISAIEYKDYKSTQKFKEYFSISFDRNSNNLEIIGYDENGENQRISGSKKDIKLSADDVYLGKTILFNHENLILNGQTYPLENITETRISEEDKHITIQFMTAIDTSELARFKRGNRIQFDSDLHIEKNDFVRGMLLNIGGNITIDGEVNKDVVSLFGNITIENNGVVRGDLASVTGKINFEKESLVYGSVYDSKKKGRGLKLRRFRSQSGFAVDPYFSYDRVDGAALSIKASHEDIDSILPTMEAEIGIGFASDRGRYKFLLEQTLLHDYSISAGGTFYRELSTNDSWLMEQDENTFFSLMAKEDYRDYYETEGGSIYLKAVPSSHTSLETGYSYYESNWIPSHRHLWALLRGKDKLFDLNYDSWQDSYRDNAIAETDTSAIGSIYGIFHYYSDSTKSETEQSNWHITAEIEISNTNLNSDFDYHRYILTVRRLQEISRQSIFTVRTLFGNSDGYLPLYRRFYLGGLGSLHGYGFKEYMGTRFWMVNSEYRIDFPRSEFGVSAFWDIGQIANDTKLDSDVEIKQSIGFSIFFEDDFTLSVAKRLDRSTNDSPKLYLRFKQSF